MPTLPIEPSGVTDVTLPSLEELRARRSDAMRIATRRLMPGAILGWIIIAPAFIALWLQQSGRMTRAGVLPWIFGSAIAAFAWIGGLLYLHIRQNLPEEMRKAGLICHACARPLIPRPQSAQGRPAPGDPGMRALVDGKCPACKAVVVRDLAEAVTRLPEPAPPGRGLAGLLRRLN